MEQTKMDISRGTGLKKMGTKEKSRYATVANVVALLVGTESLPDTKPLSELLDYGKTPLTPETAKDIIRYVTAAQKGMGHLKYQVNMALWMHKKRMKVKE